MNTEVTVITVIEGVAWLKRQEQFCENNDWGHSSDNSSVSVDEKVLCYHKKYTSLEPHLLQLLVEWIWTDKDFHGQPGFECLKKATETHKEGITVKTHFKADFWMTANFKSGLKMDIFCLESDDKKFFAFFGQKMIYEGS